MQAVLVALPAAELRARAVCIRFPAHEMQLGAFTHPSEGVRRRAVALVGGRRVQVGAGAGGIRAGGVVRI